MIEGLSKKSWDESSVKRWNAAQRCSNEFGERRRFELKLFTDIGLNEVYNS